MPTDTEPDNQALIDEATAMLRRYALADLGIFLTSFRKYEDSIPCGASDRCKQRDVLRTILDDLSRGSK